ncbi:hypothetical protein pipiens_008765 [Culex pipiens pipiens]|uniref:Uncharacterized protein n=1 Tax=Culex pipiens pipiens TaxID=38569 RepID=A0ABD1DGI4_CULPP
MVQESHVLGTTNQQQQQVTSATLALPHQTGTGTQQQLTEQHQSGTIYGSPGGRLLLGWAAGLETFLPPISWSKQLHAALQEANNVVIESSTKIQRRPDGT